MLIIYLVLPVSLKWKHESMLTGLRPVCCNVWKNHACIAVLQALRIALRSWGNKDLKFWKKSARLETYLVHQKIFHSQYCSAVCRSCSLRCEITWSFIKEKSLLAEKIPFCKNTAKKPKPNCFCNTTKVLHMQSWGFHGSTVHMAVAWSGWQSTC